MYVCMYTFGSTLDTKLGMSLSSFTMDVHKYERARLWFLVPNMTSQKMGAPVPPSFARDQK